MKEVFGKRNNDQKMMILVRRTEEKIVEERERKQQQQNQQREKKEKDRMIKEEFGIQSEMMIEKGINREMTVLIENFENFKSKENLVF